MGRARSPREIKKQPVATVTDNPAADVAGGYVYGPKGIEDAVAGVDAAIEKERTQNTSAKKPGKPVPQALVRAEALGDMSKQLDLFLKGIDQFFKEHKEVASPVQMELLKEQARRVVRNGALLTSMFAKAQMDGRYRGKLQQPAIAAQLAQLDKMCEGFQTKFGQMMGLDELHEAKVSKLKNDGKPTTVEVVIGNEDLRKDHLKADGE